MITYDKKGNPILESEVRIPYELALGASWYRFYEELRNKNIFGTRCPECKRILVPARTFCSRCFADMDEWINVSQEGVVISWSLTNYEYFGMPTAPPFINSVIKLEGTDCGFVHLIGGFDMSDPDFVSNTVKTGMKVKAVWKEERTGCIMDIQYFEPV